MYEIIKSSPQIHNLNGITKREGEKEEEGLEQEATLHKTKT